MHSSSDREAVTTPEATCFSVPWVVLATRVGLQVPYGTYACPDDRMCLLPSSVMGQQTWNFLRSTLCFAYGPLVPAKDSYLIQLKPQTHLVEARLNLETQNTV